jgi:hypothetical protein
MIKRLFYLTLKALDREVAPMARAALAKVWQYFNFSRPSMTDLIRIGMRLIYRIFLKFGI